MQCRFSFNKIKPIKILEEYAEKKILQKISRFVTKPKDIHITFFKDGHLFITHCKVKGGDGFNNQVEAKAEDKFASVDLLVNKLEAQIKKNKEKNQKPQR